MNANAPVSSVRERDQLGLSRRAFLRRLLGGASLASVAGILAACGGAATTPTPAPASTSTAPGPTSSAASAATAAPTAAATATVPATAPPTPGAAAASPSRAASPVAAAGGFPSGGKYTTLEPVGKRGGHIVRIRAEEAQTTNPLLSVTVASSERIECMFNALVRNNPDTGLPFPDLATAVPTKENGGISADGLTYTFKLRDDVKWHDGQPFTAKDVAFTYKTAMNKDLQGASATARLIAAIGTVTAPDDRTVVFALKDIVASFLTTYMVPIVPEHILGDVPVDQIKSHPFSTGDPKATVGTGPFVFKEWVHDDHAILAKNPNYFRGEPALDQLVFTVVKDANIVVTQLKTGEADFGSNIADAFIDELSNQPKLSVVSYQSYDSTVAGFQLDPAKTPLFQDKQVRHALAYGLDREAMVKTIRFGRGEVAQGIFAPPSWAYAPDQIKVKYTYDPRQAEQLLDGAGWKKGADGIRTKDGQRFSFSLWLTAGDKVYEQYATVMQQQWKAIGVEMTPKPEERSAFIARLTQARDFEMYAINYAPSVDPSGSDGYWRCKGGINLPKYCNPQVDDLQDRALRELDQEARKELYIEEANILQEDLPAIIVDFPQRTAVVARRVHNLIPNATDTYWNVHTWWVEDGK
ncbi:MAG TPA: ABC transporter substrate-binding protein [Thermomicrobiales bacterium]|nr:ABC transporter substrate-binding protein [Thermomicrobiales bacterium]